MIQKSFMQGNCDQIARTPRLLLVIIGHICQTVRLLMLILWDDWAHCGIFENGVLLMYTLEDVSSVTNFITAYEES